MTNNGSTTGTPDFNLDRAARTILHWACNGNVDQAIQVVTSTRQSCADTGLLSQPAASQLDQILGWLHGYKVGQADNA